MNTCLPELSSGTVPQMAFPPGASDLACAMRCIDWAQTPLGPASHWPPALKMALTLALQSPVAMVIMWGAAGTMLYNDSYAAIIGQHHPASLGANVSEQHTAFAVFNHHVLAVVRQGETRSYHDQHMLLDRTGVPEAAWLDLHYSPIVDEAGCVGGVLAIVTETTSRVLADRQRQQAEEYLQLALDTDAVLGTWVWRSDNKCFVPDHRMAKHFALDPHDPSGVSQAEWMARVHPDDLLPLHNVLAHAIATRAPCRVEYRARNANGAYQWVESHSRCRVAAGDITEFIGVLIDIHERKQTEAALQQSEARLRVIFDTLPVAVLFAEAESGTIIAGNQYIEGLVQQPAHAAPSIMAYKEAVVYDADGQQLPAEAFPLQIALATGEVTQRELQYQRADGTRVWMRCIGAPIRDAAGRITSGMVTMIDIDQAKREKIHQSFLLTLDERLRTIAHARDVISVACELLGRHLGANRVGYGEVDPGGTIFTVDQEWNDGRIGSFIGKHQTADFGVALADVFRSGQTMRLDDTRQDSATPAVEAAFAQIDMRSGIAIPLLHDGRCAALLYVHNATPQRWADDDVRLVKDVLERTRHVLERVRAEAQLRTLNVTLEAQVAERTLERDRIWNVSQDLLGVSDLAGVWLSVNPAWFRTLGWATDDITGRTAEWMNHPDDWPHTLEVLQHVAAGQQVARYEHRLRARDGSYRSFAWTAVASDQRLYCVARDVTAERARQAELEQTQEQLRQSQKMEAVGQLTGGIAHDFNNLLTGILGGLALVQRRVATGQVHDLDRYINMAMLSAKRAAALTHRLLAFSRRQALDVRPTDINKLVASLEDLLQRTIGAQVAFTTALQPALWPARTDANQLESALLNLCINARDAMPRGGRLLVETANVWLEPSPGEGDVAAGEYVLLRVSDSGTGMAPDVIARSVEPFFTTKAVGKGTGLGLSMVYGFVKQSGGHLRITSAVGEGTSVALFLPRDAGATYTTLAAAHAAAAPRAHPGECVLVVEDDPLVRAVVLDVLRELGYQALDACDVQEAMAHVTSSQQIDLLVMDVVLPGIDGCVLAAQVRKQRADMPVLLLTAYAADAAEPSGLLAPHVAMLQKPFALDTFATNIRRMLDPPC